MAIFGIEGKPGSGKSYEAVAFHVVESLKKGRKIITNLPLNLDHFVAVFGQDVVDELIEIRTEAKGYRKTIIKGQTFSENEKGAPFSTFECYSDDWRNEHGQGAKFIIDECHFVIPKGGTAKEISNWYSMHRHKGFDVVLLTQAFSKVDRDITNMIELVYLVQKNTMLGNEASYTRKVKCGTKGSFVNTDTRKYNPEFYPFYKSHTGVDSDVSEAYAMDIKGKWQSKTRRASLLFAALGIVGLGYTFKSLAGSDTSKQLKIEHSEVVQSIEKPKVITAIAQPAAAVLPIQKVSSQSLSTQPLSNQQTVEKPKAKEAEHPFHMVDFHIQGRITMQDFSDFVFAASRNGQQVFIMRLKDFYMAGYDVEVLGDCMINITYKDIFQKFVTCDTPSVGVF